MFVSPDALKDCVADKIATLIAEGKSPDQAAAIAISMCEAEKYVGLTDTLIALGILSPKAAKSTPLALDAIRTDLDHLTDAEKDAFERTYQRVLSLTGDPVKALLAGQGAITRLHKGLAVKARQTAEGYRVAGWAILFGDPQHRDLDQTYFGPNTNFFLDSYAHAPLWLEHGYDAQVRSLQAGYRVETEVHPEYGIWLEHQMTPDMPAFEVVDLNAFAKEVSTGAWAYSSDSLSHHVQGGFNPSKGELTVWPLAGCSLVRNPAEPGLGPAIIQRLNEAT